MWRWDMYRARSAVLAEMLSEVRSRAAGVRAPAQAFFSEQMLQPARINNPYLP